MIHFKQLQITPDNKKVIIEASISQSMPFKGFYIDEIFIEPYQNFTDTQTMSNGNTPFSLKIHKEKKIKQVRLELTSIDFTNYSIKKGDLLFVYIRVKFIKEDAGNVIPTCTQDKEVTIGVAYNKYDIYHKIISYMKELNCCEVPKHFINWYLRWKAIEIAEKTCNYSSLVELWKKFSRSPLKGNKLNSNCGCNG